jgi:hypothetical protein
MSASMVLVMGQGTLALTLLLLHTAAAAATQLTWSAMSASMVLVMGQGTLALTLTVTSIWQPSLLLLISSSARVLRLLASDICAATEQQHSSINMILSLS